MHRCPICNKKLRKHHNFCPSCGTSIPMGDAYFGDRDAKGKHNVKAVTLIVLVLSVIMFCAYFVIFNFSDDLTLFSKNGLFTSATPFSDDPIAITETSKSVVMLYCYDSNGQLYTTGSGFACFADNVIVTNYHVVESDAASIEARTENGDVFDVAYVLATDADKDIAILSTEFPHNLTLLQPANSDALQKGEKVVAIGSPLGLINSVSAGVFSGYVEENNVEVLQFTASISSGSSGGALFNDDGEVLGITFASYEDGQNLNLAVPINYVNSLWNSANMSNKLTVKEFWDTFPHPQPVNEVIANAAEFDGQEIILEGYVSHISSMGFQKDIHINLVANEDDILGNVDDSKAVADQRFGGESIVLWYSQNSNCQYVIGDYVTVSGMFHIMTYEKSKIHRGGSMYILYVE